MKPDILRDAARALRETTDEGASPPRETREAILRGVHERRARRLTLLKTVLPLAAVLIASTAWGAASGHWPKGLATIEATFGLLRNPEAIESASTSSPPFDAPVSDRGPALEAPAPDLSAIAPPIDSAPIAPETPPPLHARGASPNSPASSRGSQPSVSGHSVAEPSAAIPTSSPIPTSIPAAAAVDMDHELYVTAHRLHFVDHDARAALSAWDTYLRAAPRGRFAVEAQYNRAICLVRLGRTADARPILEAFANGGFGSYRRVEAKGLLDAMEGRSP